MSRDYPNRADWLAKRYTPRVMCVERMIRPMGTGGASKDPGRTHAHRRRKGPLSIATGPGSINAESEMRRLVMDGKFTEAAAFYESCFRIHYKHGKPQMGWGTEWYRRYKASRAVA